jgi:DNA-binding transcriptional MocR family regulator
MKTAADDFRIFWDNAYTVHHLSDTPDKLKNIMDACKAAGNPDRVYIFGSTSKVSFAGSGLGFLGASEANLNYIREALQKQTIGPDKINQLRHVRFFKDMDGINAHMKKHAEIIKPKFDAVVSILDTELAGKGIANWSNPAGGYFVNFDVPEGCAKKVVAMAADAGVKLTGAGATFPYKKDPRNSNIRIAPTLPSLDEIKKATEVVAVCTCIAAIENIL